MGDILLLILLTILTDFKILKLTLNFQSKKKFFFTKGFYLSKETATPSWQFH